MNNCQDKKTFIIIPAYNEGPRIFKVLKSIKESETAKNINAELVVIDDGSTDDTYEQALRAGIKALKHPINRGQGAALQTGNEYALMHGAGFIVHFDADGQHQVESITALLDSMIANGLDMVLGSRFFDSMKSASLSGVASNLTKFFSTIYRGLFKIRTIPLLRRIFLIGNFMVNTMITGVLLTDGHNGLRAFTAETARKLDLHQDRYAHPTEYITEIKRLDLKYGEIQVNVRYDINKKSQGFFDALVILKDLFIGKSVKP